MSEDTEEDKLVDCPFCYKPEFDQVGLKIHLSMGHCGPYNCLSIALPRTVLKQASGAEVGVENEDLSDI